jgi:hypothetical protein
LLSRSSLTTDASANAARRVTRRERRVAAERVKREWTVVRARPVPPRRLLTRSREEARDENRLAGIRADRLREAPAGREAEDRRAAHDAGDSRQAAELLHRVLDILLGARARMLDTRFDVDRAIRFERAAARPGEQREPTRVGVVQRAGAVERYAVSHSTRSTKSSVVSTSGVDQVGGSSRVRSAIRSTAWAGDGAGVGAAVVTCGRSSAPKRKAKAATTTRAPAHVSRREATEQALSQMEARPFGAVARFRAALHAEIRSGLPISAGSCIVN